MRYVSDRTLVVAAGLLACAAFIFGIAFARAASAPSLPVPAAVDADAEPWAVPAEPAPTGEVEGGITLDELVVAADNDPFQPDRQRPAERYRLASDLPAPQPGEPAPAAPPAPPAEPPAFRILGTITGADGAGGVAVIQAGNASPRVVSVGEEFEGYTLAFVRPDAATVVGNGGMFALNLVEASPDPRPARAAQRPDARARPEAGQAMDPAAAAARAAEMIGRMMQGGGAGRGGAGRDGQMQQNIQAIIRDLGRAGTIMIRGTTGGTAGGTTGGTTGAATTGRGGRGG